MPCAQGIQRVDGKGVQKACGGDAGVGLNDDGVPGGRAGDEGEVGVKRFAEVEREPAQERRDAVVAGADSGGVAVTPPMLVVTTLTVDAWLAAEKTSRATDAAKILQAVNRGFKVFSF